MYLAGWRVRSEFRIPGLAPWAGVEKPPDVTISTGALPDRHSTLALDGPLMQVARDGACWFTVPGIAAFYINRDATAVTVDARDPADSGVGAFLLGTVFGILCHKRGLLALHASCVEIGGRAVAFAGPSSLGKSLLAAALTKQGCSILADDITVIDTASLDGPVALPSFPRLRLWRDALHALGMEDGEKERARPELEKYDVPSVLAANPRPLAAIYHLGRERVGTLDAITRISGARAIRTAGNAVYCIHAARALVGESAMLGQIARFCAAVPTFALAQQPGFEAVPARVKLLLDEHGDAS